MNCDRIEQLLPFLHDGSLEPQVMREVERHLEQCPECAETYAGLSAVVNLTRNVLGKLPVRSNPGYVAAVRERIRKRMHTRSLFRWAVPAAAAVFLAVSVGTYSLFLTGGVKYQSPGVRTIRTAQPSPAPAYTATVDEDALISAMYHYTDVTLDDLMSRMDENELAAALDIDER